MKDIRDIEKELEKLALHHATEIQELMDSISLSEFKSVDLKRYGSCSLMELREFAAFCEQIIQAKYGMAWRKMTGTNFRGMDLISEKMNRLMCQWVELKRGPQ